MLDRSYGTIPFRVEVGVVKFLLVWENRGEGHWNFPKGHAEEGETPLEAALRELKEETGLVPEAVLYESPLAHEYSFEYEGWTIKRRIIYYLALVGDTSIELQREEVSKYRWMTQEEISNATPYPELKKLARSAYVLAAVYCKGNA